MARPLHSVENYTTPALVMGLVNLIGLLSVICVVWGFPAALLTAWGFHRAISVLERRKKAS